MRLWFSGPRIFGIRPGISVSPNEFHGARQANNATTNRNEGSFLYVIQGGHNMVKVGVTTNPTARIASLRTGSAFPLEFSFIGVANGSGYPIERKAHELLSKNRCAGEWFSVPPEMAISAVTAAAADLGISMKIVDEATSTKILQISAHGNNIRKRPSWRIGNIFGFLFRGSLYYMIMLFGLAIAGFLKDDGTLYVYLAIMMLIAFTASYFDSRPKILKP